MSYGRFDAALEQWLPEEEPPYCQCPECGADMYRGEYGYWDGCQMICEECFDKMQDAEKEEALIEVGED